MNDNESIGLKNTMEQQADKVEITFFTDPLCCWSWALEPHWQRLLSEYKEHIKWKYCMVGLVPDWKSYADPVNSVNRPAQMGPVWMQASHISGVPIASEIWITDPPVSSYPACIAVKCAEMQSPFLGELFLRLLREGVMLHLQNISREDVLLNIARQLAEQQDSFHVERFTDDLYNGNGQEAFRQDWHQTQLQRIERYPSLIFRRKGHKSILLSGYQPYEILLKAFLQMAPELVPATSIEE